MLRMNYWRTTVIQIVAKYVRQYLTGGKRNPILPISYLERSKRLSSTSLEEFLYTFLLTHQVKLSLQILNPWISKVTS